MSIILKRRIQLNKSSFIVGRFYSMIQEKENGDGFFPSLEQ